LSSLTNRAKNDGRALNGVAYMSSVMNEQTVSSTEEYLLNLWRSQLERPHLSVQDDFFEAGGSSMQVIEMLMTVSSKLGIEIDFAEFFNEPCIRKLSELLNA
jgi:acyl carrier protein